MAFKFYKIKYYFNIQLKTNEITEGIIGKAKPLEDDS